MTFHDILCLFSYPMTKSLIQNGHWLMDFPKWIQSIQDAMLMLISNQMQPGLWLLEDNCNFEKYFNFPILNPWLRHGLLFIKDSVRPKPKLGPNFGQFRPKQFGQVCRTTQSAKKRHFLPIYDQFSRIASKYQIFEF